ncbi:MAG TPA: MarR family transcriptional regulator [Phycisphaerae bacterium]|nr:MarR family transcriptional regulator [Phycisphaerae bacterium]
MPDPSSTRPTATHAPAAPAITAARREFVDLWGQMANHWGINRTMAQIHALLMISAEPLTAEQLMDELQISRGNVSMNLRDLINWGIVRRTSVPGDRRDFFITEADVWTMFQVILRERKKRELDPLLTRLDECLALAGKKPEPGAAPADKAAHETYLKRVSELRDFFNTFHRLFSAVLDNQPGSLAKAVKLVDKFV